MALSIKQLNGDASFLLTFEPIVGDESFPSIFQEPFRILLDPWLRGAARDHRTKLSQTAHRRPALLPTLNQIPAPDLVIISQHKGDHCNEATLRQLPGTGTKTIILAEPAAAKRIQEWKHFDPDKVIALPRWEDPRQTGREAVTRIIVPPQTLGGDAGEVTVAFIPQRRDFRNQHPAIGITYRPPPSRPSRYIRPGMTPPQLHPPRSPTATTAPTIRPVITLLPTPPASPSLRSQRSTVSLTPQLRDRAVSVLYAPHGTTYSSIEPYATSHLVNEAALPLTALLHCFDDVEGPWWRPSLSSPRSKGMSAGVETAGSLGARAWVSAHDGEKTARGLLNRGIRRRRNGVAEVRREMGLIATDAAGHRSFKRMTEVLALGIGEEVAMTSEGIWDMEPRMATPNSSRGSFDNQSMLVKYGMGDVLANIASEPFAQLTPRKPRLSCGSKLHIETCTDSY